jgi:hypothetical protein
MKSWNLYRRLQFRPWMMGLVFSVVVLSGCGGGPDLCKCLEEADKENPDQTIMDKCRDAFSKMEMDEVQKAVEECGR